MGHSSINIGRAVGAPSAGHERELTMVPFMNRNAKMVMRSGGVVFAVELVISMFLGYSGTPRLASVGNVVLLFTFLAALAVLAVGVLIWLITRETGVSTTRDRRA